MDYLQDISDFVDALDDYGRPCADQASRAAANSVLDSLPAIEERMAAILHKLQDRMAALRAFRAAAYVPQEAEPSSPAPSADGWLVVRRRRRHPPAERRHPSIDIAPGIRLDCRIIGDIREVPQDGHLYYDQRLQRFGLRINGVLLHGNIGIVYGGEAIPEKIKDCKVCAMCDPATCTYYHDPMKCSSSSDTRNFIASSWLYSPCRSSRKDSGAYRVRKLSSRERLSADIPAIHPSEVPYYNEQLMHDILCGLVMNRYVPSARRHF